MFEMKGTSGASFTVIAATPAGKVGYRNLGSSFRVRVEPATGKALTFPGGWKSPEGSQNRFSIVVGTPLQLAGAVGTAVAILTASSLN